MRLYFSTLLFCVLMGCKPNTELQLSIEGKSIPIDQIHKMDSSILDIYTPYKERLDSIMNEVLCYSPYFLEKKKPEARLNNWMADVCFEHTKKNYIVDFCLLNYGGIRATLPKGPITRKNIFQLMPFENELVIVEIPDSSFTKALNYLKISGGHPISNLQVTITDNQISHSLPHKKTVRIVTSDYLANGGDKMYFFSDSLSMLKTNLKIRDVLLSECKSIDTLITIIDNRFVYEQ